MREDGGEGAWETAVSEEEEQEEGDKDDEQHLNPNSAEAIRKRLQRFQKRLAKRKEKTDKQQEQSNDNSKDHKFKGIISQVFDPYLTIYIAQQDKRIGEEMEKIVREEAWDVDDDDNKVLGSSTDMVYFFYAVMKQSQQLSTSQPFFELYKLFKKYEKKYATVIDNKLQSMGTGGLTDKQERAVLLIINTADYCSQTTNQLADKIRAIIDPAFVVDVDFSQEKEEFESILAKAVRTLVQGLEGKLAPALVSMTKMPWNTWESVGDQSPYVNQISTYISQTIPMYATWLKDAHFRFFCDSFVGSFIPRIIENIYKCRQISEIAAEQLLLDMTSIKTILADLPTLSQSGGDPPRRYVKYVNRAMGKAEVLLKLVITPQESLVETYQALVTDGTEADFQRVMELKGLKKDESFLKSFLEQYNAFRLKK
jgi:flagellar hook-basal body complex protein FliE